MATIGRNKAIADLKVIKLSGFLAWLSWLLIHLLFIVELRNRILIFFQWAWAYFTYSAWRPSELSSISPCRTSKGRSACRRRRNSVIAA